MFSKSIELCNEEAKRRFSDGHDGSFGEKGIMKYIGTDCLWRPYSEKEIWDSQLLKIEDEVLFDLINTQIKSRIKPDLNSQDFIVKLFKILSNRFSNNEEVVFCKIGILAYVALSVFEFYGTATIPADKSPTGESIKITYTLKTEKRDEIISFTFRIDSKYEIIVKIASDNAEVRWCRELRKCYYNNLLSRLNRHDDLDCIGSTCSKKKYRLDELFLVKSKRDIHKSIEHIDIIKQLYNNTLTGQEDEEDAMSIIPLFRIIYEFMDKPIGIENNYQEKSNDLEALLSKIAFNTLT